MSCLQAISSSRCFNGCQQVYRHDSSELKCSMQFGIYLPDAALLSNATKWPVLYYLSGEDCTHQTFIKESGAQRYASEYQLILVNCDTMPREVGAIPDCNCSGLYVDAVVEPWSTHYRMYSYVSKELPNLIEGNFPVSGYHKGIFGHNSGSIGAICCALKNPGFYKSVSAFASTTTTDSSQLLPRSPNFQCLLGDDGHSQYDLCSLVDGYQGPKIDILIDMGYDNSYHFVSTFMADHIRHHVSLESEEKVFWEN